MNNKKQIIGLTKLINDLVRFGPNGAMARNSEKQLKMIGTFVNDMHTRAFDSKRSSDIISKQKDKKKARTYVYKLAIDRGLQPSLKQFYNRLCNCRFKHMIFDAKNGLILPSVHDLLFPTLDGIRFIATNDIPNPTTRRMSKKKM